MAITTNAVSAATMAITVSNPPTEVNSPGATGTIAWDDNFFYVCIATDTWARTGYSTAW